MLATIMKTMKAMHPADSMVVVIASHLCVSKIMPMMPNIKETGSENNISSPPRTGIGLPQPGLRTHIVTITAPTITQKAAESFPKSIFLHSEQDFSHISWLTLYISVKDQ
jgi:hypothetical protein